VLYTKIGILNLPRSEVDEARLGLNLGGSNTTLKSLSLHQNSKIMTSVGRIRFSSWHE